MSGRFGYRFRLEKKIGAMTETPFIDPKSYLAIFLASRSTSVNSRPHSLPSTNAGHLLSSMVVPSSNTNEQSVCNIDDKCRFGYSSRKARPKSDLPADRSPPTASDNPELGQRRRRREEKVLSGTCPMRRNRQSQDPWPSSEMLFRDHNSRLFQNQRPP